MRKETNPVESPRQGTGYKKDPLKLSTYENTLKKPVTLNDTLKKVF